MDLPQLDTPSLLRRVKNGLDSVFTFITSQMQDAIQSHNDDVAEEMRDELVELQEENAELIRLTEEARQRQLNAEDREILERIHARIERKRRMGQIASELPDIGIDVDTDDELESDTDDEFTELERTQNEMKRQINELSRQVDESKPDDFVENQQRIDKIEELEEQLEQLELIESEEESGWETPEEYEEEEEEQEEQEEPEILVKGTPSWERFIAIDGFDDELEIPIFKNKIGISISRMNQLINYFNIRPDDDPGRNWHNADDKRSSLIEYSMNNPKFKEAISSNDINNPSHVEKVGRNNMFKESYLRTLR